VWADDELCPVSTEVRRRIERVAGLLKNAGATLDEQARPAFAAEHSHDTYQHLLQATMATRMADADFRGLQARVAELDPNDHSNTAKVLRGQVSSFRDWTAGNEARHKLRWRWHEFFRDFDVMLAPIMPTAAFAHDHRPFGERTIRIDDRELPYFQQVFWAGLTGVAYLPSTVIPTGLNDDGLPIGIQIVGPEYGDLVTIGVARLLEAAGCRYVPPPAYL
jgi:amidase